MSRIYRIYCTTESSWINTISNESPTVCSNNASHAVNQNSVQILSKIPDVWVPYSLTGTLDATGTLTTLSVELSSTVIPEGSYSLIVTTDSGGAVFFGVVRET